MTPRSARRCRGSPHAAPLPAHPGRRRPSVRSQMATSMMSRSWSRPLGCWRGVVGLMRRRAPPSGHRPKRSPGVRSPGPPRSRAAAGDQSEEELSAIDAGKSCGRPATRVVRAGMPPAEAPITTMSRWVIQCLASSLFWTVTWIATEVGSLRVPQLARSRPTGSTPGAELPHMMCSTREAEEFLAPSRFLTCSWLCEPPPVDEMCRFRVFTGSMSQHVTCRAAPPPKG